MQCIETICLYLKSYLSDQQFQKVFYDCLSDFQSFLQEEMFLDILWINFESKEETLHLRTELYKYVLGNHKLTYDKINDAYVECFLDLKEENLVAEILKKRYEKREEISIDCGEITTQAGLICAVKKALGYPETCGENWDAVEDFIFDMIFPKKLVFHHWSNIKEKLPQDAAVLKSILDKVCDERCMIVYL